MNNKIYQKFNLGQHQLKQRYLAVIVLIFGILISKTFSAEVNILSPNSLKEEFSGNPLEVHASKFGDIPYGQTMEGILVLANPMDACFDADVDYHVHGSPKPFLLIEHNDQCTTSFKMKHAQQHGAALVIFYSTSQGELPQLHVNNGYQFEIPSMIVQKDTGMSLRKSIHNGDLVQLSIHFQKSLQDQFNMFLDLRNLINSATYVHHFAESRNWFPYYDIKPYFYLEQNMGSQYNQVCYGRGLYCLETEEQLYEALFQACLFRVSEDSFLNYNTYIYEYSKIFNKVKKDTDPTWAEKSKLQQEQELHTYAYSLKSTLLPILEAQSIGNMYITEDIKQCIDTSFEKETGNKIKFDHENDLLDESVKEIKKYQIDHFPSAVINDQLVSQVNFHKISDKQGDYASYVLYQICKNSQVRTRSCSQYIFNYNSKYHLQNTEENDDFYENSAGLPTVWVVVIVALCFIFLSILFVLVYRIKLNYQYENESEQIEGLIENYYKMHSQSKKNQEIELSEEEQKNQKEIETKL